MYCLEGADTGGLDPRDIVLPAEPEFSAHRRPDLLDGVTTVRVDALAMPPGSGWNGALYRDNPSAGVQRPVPVELIPYYAWANREPGRMEVWLRSE
jgi:DUF1680 family protein